jgi:hypothetical protein
VIGISTGSALFVIIIGSLIWLLIRRRWQKQPRRIREETTEDGLFLDDDQAMEDDFEKGTGPRRFPYNDLVGWSSPPTTSPMATSSEKEASAPCTEDFSRS